MYGLTKKDKKIALKKISFQKQFKNNSFQILFF